MFFFWYNLFLNLTTHETLLHVTQSILDYQSNVLSLAMISLIFLPGEMQL